MAADSRRLLTEAFLAEATFEVPDEWVEPLGMVLRGAARRRVLPANARDWIKAPTRNRRASDRPVAPSGSPPPAAPTGSRSARKGRELPSTNRFVQQAAAGPDDFEDEPTDPGVGPSDFPDFPAPRPAATHVGYPADDRVYSQGILGGDDDRGIEVPEPGGGRGMRTLRGTEPRRPGSISRLFRRRPPDGRRQLDKALKAADREARRRAGKQGTLSRLIRGRDVTR